MKITITGVVLCIAITTSMDVTGYSTFSALPLFPLLGIFWYLQRFSRKEIGYTWGRPRDYGLAMLYPLVVLGIATVLAWLAGEVDISSTDWHKASLNMLIIALSTVILATLTEEGFFRGWLMASLKHARCSQVQVLLWSSIAFSLWHLSAVSLGGSSFNLPLPQIPVFLVNAFLLGAIWGMLRMISGSVIVASVCHGAWNGINYVLFAFGEEVGALGIENTSIFGPEVGVVGLVLNLLFAVWLWHRWKSYSQNPV